MDVRTLLSDLFGRVDEHVDEILDGLDPGSLTRQPAPGTNPIGWLLWHIARVEDAQVAELRGDEQLWAGGPWAARFGLAPDPANHGYGHTPADVAAVRPEGVEALRDYARAVRARTDEFLATLTSDDLDRIVDEAWDPPVTMGVRLISVADDQIQHAGAAAYVKGLLQQS
jgi:uncharacterized damage-inducible protein DinB